MQPQDLEALQARAEAGEVAAQLELARAYACGVELPRDEAAAAAWYERALTQGSPAAMAGLARLLLARPGDPRALARAVALARQAAEAGDARGRTTLGLAHLLGRGVRRDHAEARRLFALAAEELPEAASNMGLMDMYGWAGPRDQVAGLARIRAGATAGVPAALHNMGLFHQLGLGVPRDPAAAVGWFRQAAEAGSPDGAFALFAAHLWGRGAVRDGREAVRWLQIAAARGHARAALALGFRHEFGWGLPRDRQAAQRWYEEALLRGDRLAGPTLWRFHAGWRYWALVAYFAALLAYTWQLQGACPRAHQLVIALAGTACGLVGLALVVLAGRRRLNERRAS